MEIDTKLSMYWVTRKRSHSLMVSLSSYIMNADDNSKIEYIVIMDDDDEESEKALQEAKLIFQSLYGVELKIFVVERVGYGALHYYHNLAAINFTGDCLLLRNDDHFCLTEGWDTKMHGLVKQYKDEPIVIHQKGVNEKIWWSTAPGINRKWYDVSTNNGEIAAFSDVGCDVWLLRIAEQAGRAVVYSPYTMMSMQRGEEHSHKVGKENQLPNDEVLEDRRNAEKVSEPEVRELLIQNLKNWTKC